MPILRTFICQSCQKEVSEYKPASEFYTKCNTCIEHDAINEKILWKQNREKLPLNQRIAELEDFMYQQMIKEDYDDNKI